ncbi:MAG: PH domain-containing protein [Chloroflexota bacterium]|nr:PH domain-containing protein [Chloroflexota bacterium]MDE2970364.1 PH domain-containing protein [Chloroflexota bacterium]
MRSPAQTRSIDNQWYTLQPAWGLKDYEGEREMLYDLLDPGEDIELLHPCGFHAGNSSHDRGIVVATGSRVILLNRGRLSRNRFGLTYLEVDEITEPEPGRVRLRGVGSGDAPGSLTVPVFDLDLQSAAADFSRFVSGRLLSDDESVAAAYSHVLAPGEQVRHWAHCSAGLETAKHFDGKISTAHVHDPDYWATQWQGWPAIAVATDDRMLLIKLAVDGGARKEEIIACPHGTIPAVECVEHAEGQQVRFIDQRGQVYAAHFRREVDALPFVKVVRDHAGVFGQPRIDAAWKLHHPLWALLDEHGKERRKLAEVLHDDEHLEALLYGTYTAELPGAKGHNAVVAATDRRLLFVSNSWDDKHVSQLPLDRIAGVSRKGDKLRVDAAEGYDGHVIDVLDNKSRHDSRKKGHVEAFTARLQRLIEDLPC